MKTDTMKADTMKTPPASIRRITPLCAFRNFCVSLLIGSSMVGMLRAAPLVDINFSSDSLSGPPATTFIPAAGDTIVRPNSISNPAAFTIAENYQSNGVTLPGRSVVFRVDKPEGGSSQGGAMNIWGNEADFEIGKDYVLKADLLFNGAFGDLASSSLAINLYNAAYDYTGYQARLIFSNNNIILYSNGCLLYTSPSPRDS